MSPSVEACKSPRGIQLEQCIAEQVDNHLCKRDISTYALDPNNYRKNNSDDATVITSNTSRASNSASARNIASALQQGVPKVLAFSDTHAIADTHINLRDGRDPHEEHL